MAMAIPMRWRNGQGKENREAPAFHKPMGVKGLIEAQAFHKPMGVKGLIEELPFHKPMGVKGTIDERPFHKPMRQRGICAQPSPMARPLPFLGCAHRARTAALHSHEP